MCNAHDEGCYRLTCPFVCFSFRPQKMQASERRAAGKQRKASAAAGTPADAPQSPSSAKKQRPSGDVEAADAPASAKKRAGSSASPTPSKRAKH